MNRFNKKITLAGVDMPHSKDMIGKLRIHMLILLVAGCSYQSPNKHTSYDVSNISEGIKQRTDYTLRQASEPNQFDIPDWVTLNDGLSQGEAVALALWNNAQFRTDLTALGFARADLLEANMLKNPVFSLLFPVSPELAEAELEIPIDALWQRPHRIAVAELEAEIKDAVVNQGATVKGEFLMAVYNKPRVSWNTKGLDGFAVAHPEVKAFQSFGKPSVTIRSR